MSRAKFFVDYSIWIDPLSFAYGLYCWTQEMMAPEVDYTIIRRRSKTKGQGREGQAVCGWLHGIDSRWVKLG